MKVMLHGAINMSNYGDYIFAEMFYNELKDKNVEVEFYCHPKYGISNYFSKYLSYIPDRKHYREIMNECDALVFISGGYFVEPLKKGILSEIRHIHRYVTPAEFFMRSNKPIYIMGVGAGPFTNAPFSKKAADIMNYASVISVRNEESKQFCIENGVKKDILVTADTALLIREYLCKYKVDIPHYDFPAQKKLLLFHIDSSQDVKERLREDIVPGVKRFLLENPEYQILLTADGLKNEELYESYFKMFEEFHPVVEVYDDPWKLTRVIDRADLIITTKLHMGIVGSSLGKSVVSFPYVSNKTKRFYKQIGQEDRCVSLFSINKEEVYSLLEEFKDKKITVGSSLIDEARKNLSLLPM